jgi:CubicO group peptidase (beta-lactamase class C family)
VRWSHLTVTLVCACQAPAVDPTEYGCRELWTRPSGTCIDAETFEDVIREGLWAPGNEVMGFAFAAGDAEGLALKGACGLARTARDGGARVFEADMRIESGSTSKMLTVVAALRVLELIDGVAGLDAPMNDFLPLGWTPHESLASANITLDQLLSHRSGLVNTGGIGLRPILQDEKWFEAQWIGSYRYANHNLDAAGFVSTYLLHGDGLRNIDATLLGDEDYDAQIDLEVRDRHYEMLMDLTVQPAGLDLDCIRFAWDSQEVWLYADGRDQEGYRLPSRMNCMTSGFLVSAPQWVEWVQALQNGALIDSASLERLNAWDGPEPALGWNSNSTQWRSHGGSYSPEGVGVETTMAYRRDGFAASVVTNSKNADGLSELAKEALEEAATGCD